MKSGRKILVLDTGGTASPLPQEIADDLARLGAEVTVRPLDKRYDDILDAVAAADTVVCWR